MIPIKGFSTFDPLKHCIVGKAHSPDNVDEPLKNIMQRFEFSEDQKSFIPNLKKFGFDETVTYLTYEKDLSDGSFNHLIDVAENDFQQVNDCLSCFQIFSTEKLKELVARI